MILENNQIEFRKEREFSQLISVTFEFIKREFKMFMILLTRIAGPLLLLSLIISIPSSIGMMTMAFEQKFMIASSGLFSNTAWNMLATLFQVFATLLFFISVNEYVRLYVEGKKGISVKDVWERTKKNFWRYFGAGILVTIMVGAGMVLLIIPGIYLLVATSFVFIIITMENASISRAIDRSFYVIKGNWWTTFGFYFIIMIIQFGIIYTVLLPASLFNIGFITGYFVPAGYESFPIWYYVVFSLISILTTIVSVAASLIFYVAVNFNYFSLIEKKEQTGLKMQIEKMGAEQDAE